MSLLDKEEVEEHLAEALRKLGYSAAAAVLEAGTTGYMSLPESMAATRDGREEAISSLKEAFEDKRISVIVIERER
jgi:hypothetical protein